MGMLSEPAGGGITWETSNSVAFDEASSPTSWSELDLSSIVGARRTIALIAIENNSGVGSDDYAVRSADETKEVCYDGATAGGLNYMRTQFGRFANVIVETNASGIIDWKATLGRPTLIRVRGWLTT